MLISAVQPRGSVTHTFFFIFLLLWLNHRIRSIVPCATLFLKFCFVGVGCNAASVSAVYTDMFFSIVCFRNLDDAPLDDSDSSEDMGGWPCL